MTTGHAMEGELERMRDRVHKIADELQEHRLKIGEHELRLTTVAADVSDLHETMATSDQLDSVKQTLTLKLDHLTETVSPLRRGLNWAVGLILSGVLLAVLNLVLRSQGRP